MNLAVQAIQKHFEPGDRVAAFGGEQLMEVVQVRSDGRVFCKWYEDGRPQSQGIFHPGDLHHATWRAGEPYRRKKHQNNNGNAS